MVNWLGWIGKLIAAVIAFIQVNPVPHRGPVGRIVARRAAIRQMVNPGYGIVYAFTPAAAVQAQAPTVENKPYKDTVVDTIPQTEGYGHFRVNTVYEWKERSTEPGSLLLFKNGTQIGGWCLAGRKYLDYDARTNTWAQVCTPTGCVPAFKDCAPVPVPEKRRQETPTTDDGDNGFEWISGLTPEFLIAQAEDKPTGVDFERLRDRTAGHRYTKGGREITRNESFEALANAMPADAGSMRLTCIGPNCNASKLIADMAAAGPLAEWRDKVTIQTYDGVSDPMINGFGYAASGVQVQAPDGLPLWYAQTYETPEKLAEGLAQAQQRREFAQARKKDGSWNPDDWTKLAQAATAPKVSPVVPPAVPADPMPPMPAVPAPVTIPAWGIWAALGGLLLLLARVFKGIAAPKA